MCVCVIVWTLHCIFPVNIAKAKQLIINILSIFFKEMSVISWKNTGTRLNTFTVTLPPHLFPCMYQEMSCFWTSLYSVWEFSCLVSVQAEVFRTAENWELGDYWWKSPLTRWPSLPHFSFLPSSLHDTPILLFFSFSRFQLQLSPPEAPVTSLILLLFHIHVINIQVECATGQNNHKHLITLESP